MPIFKNPKRKKLLIESLAASFLVAFVFASMLPNASASTAYYLEDATVELDGVNDGVVTVNLKSPIADKIYSIEGNFLTQNYLTEGDDNILVYTLTGLTPPAGITPASNTVVDGRILWQDASWTNPLEVEAGGTLWSATYTVDKDTPAGEYGTVLMGTYIASMSEDYDTVNLGYLYGKLTVTRSDTPAVKPNQVVTFRDGEGNPVTEVSKYYQDENFTITKEVTTGDGAITEYHPDDDGSGSIVTTIPGGDVVTVGIPGDMQVCAWVAETENYAATKACYTVHVLKRPLDITGVTIADKTYDGTTTATVTSVSFEDKTLTSDQYTTTATFDDADAGENKAVHVSVSLTESAANYYVLNASNYNTTKTIEKYLLTADNMSVAGGSTHTYTPGGVEPDVVVTANTHGGLTTLGDDDYDVEYENNTSVGSATIKVTGKGNYTTGSDPVTLNFNIEPRGFNDSNVTAPSSIVEGHILTADEISVNVDGVELVRCATADDTNCDYTVVISGENDGVVGHTVNVAINGCNNYSGVGARDISVVAKLPQTVTFGGVSGDIEKAYGDADFTYTATTDGNGVITYSSSNETVATVDANGKVTLHEVGEANIIATAAETDTYAQGSTSYHLVVSKKAITVSSVAVANKTFDGTSVATINDVVLSESSLVYNTDVTATGLFDDVTVGEHGVDVTVTLSDDAFAHYCFTRETSCMKNTSYAASGMINTFTLGADNATATLDSIAYKYDGEAKEPTAGVTVDLDGDGTKETTLTVGTDYEVSYNNNINAGTATATITGKGNYAGSLSALEFTIDPATVENVVVTAPAQTYTGEALEPVVTVTGTVNGSSVTFTTDDFVVADHEGFVTAGDHTFAIESKAGSNYAIPTTNGTFTISKADSGDATDVPSDLAAEVGQTLADLGEMPEGFAWVDPTTPITAGVNDYPATYTKNGDTANYTTADITVSVLGFTEEYDVIKGDGQDHIIGVDGAAEFEINAEYELFVDGGSVYVDNELVEPAYYESWSSSTVISLSREFMDSLSIGSHTLSVLFNNGGVARAAFTVSEPEPEPAPGAADTGAFTSVAGGAVATGLMTAVVASLAFGAMYVAKKRNK